MSSMHMWFPWLMQAVPIIAMGIFLPLIPRRTRPDVWFSVTVEPGFRDTPEARAVEGRYRIAVRIHSALSLAILVALSLASMPTAAPLAIAWMLLGSTAAFLTARNQTLPHAAAPDTTREASLRRDPPEPGLPLLARVGPFLLLAISAMVIHSRWDRIPERVPLHWNGGGHIDRWGEKTAANLYGPLLVGVGLCVFLALLGGAMGRVRRVSASGASAQREAKFRRTMQRIMLGAQYLEATVFSLITVPMLGGPIQVIPIGAGAMALAFLLWTVLSILRVGQGGTALGPVEAGAKPVGDRTADRYWKAGMFYVNPDDSAIFVEKRFGVGYTINFGRASAWGILAATLLLPIIIALLVRANR